MFEGLLEYNDIGLFILRLGLGIIFIYHAIPKVKNPKAMAQMMGGSAAMPLVLGLIELLSGIGIIVGFYTQLAALLLGIVMIGAIGMKTMKWNTPFAAMDKTGWEFDLILLAGSIAILMGGGGAITLF